MDKRIDKDWTDALRETLEGAGLTPSEGGWERLRADLHPRKSVHWPYYALAAAACAAVCGVFIFRGAPDAGRIEVVESSGMVADVPATAEDIVLETELSEETAAGQFVPSAVKPVAVALRQAGPAAAEPAQAAVEEPEAVVIEPEAEEIVEVEAVEETVPEVKEVPQVIKSEPVFVDDFPMEDLSPRRVRRKPTLSVSAGGAFGSASGRNSVLHHEEPLTRASSDVVDISEAIQHSTPLNARLDLFVPLSDRLGIGTGLDLSSHKSTIGDAVQAMKWIGLPVKLDYSVGNWGPYKMNVAAGVKGEKCLSASLLGMNFNESFQWAANVGADCRVNLFGPVSLIVAPELDYYFTDTVLPTYRTGKPLSFNICAGLSFNL